MAAPPEDNEDIVMESLNAMESAAMLVQEPGITTITFFSSSDADSDDFAKAAQYFRDRLLLVVQANPWAAGRVVRHRKHLQLVYPKTITPEVLDRILVIQDCAADDEEQGTPLHSELPYEEICAAIDKHSAMLPSGTTCINQDVLVTRVTLVPGSSSSSFALVVSMSHTIADGYTYYRILNMLSSNEPIVRLNAKRKPNIDATKVAWNDQDWRYVTTNIGMIINLVWGMVTKKAKCYAFYVDPEQIQAIKDEEKSRHLVDYVSTNDILVANHSTLVKPRIQTMALNFRQRVTGAEASDAGNYESALLLDQASYQTPSAVRQSLGDYTKDATCTGRTLPLPGIWESFTSKNLMAQLSNWASFFDQIEIPPPFQQELHLPIVNIHKMPFDCAVLFKPKANRTAIMYICTTPAFQNWAFWQANAPVGEVVSTHVFGGRELD